MKRIGKVQLSSLQTLRITWKSGNCLSCEENIMSGLLAQLGEHLGHNQVVVGSNPAVSTSYMYFEEALSGPGSGLESAF